MKLPVGFPPQRRLSSADQFREVLESGKRFSSPHFTCVVRKKGGEDKKLGIGVSRKVGGAVLRNRIKRWVREVFRLNQHLLTSGFHLVVLVREKSRLKDLKEAEANLLAVFNKAGLLKND